MTTILMYQYVLPHRYCTTQGEIFIGIKLFMWSSSVSFTTTHKRDTARYCGRRDLVHTVTDLLKPQLPRDYNGVLCHWGVHIALPHCNSPWLTVATVSPCVWLVDETTGLLKYSVSHKIYIKSRKGKTTDGSDTNCYKFSFSWDDKFSYPFFVFM